MTQILNEWEHFDHIPSLLVSVQLKNSINNVCYNLDNCMGFYFPDFQ